MYTIVIWKYVLLWAHTLINTDTEKNCRLSGSSKRSCKSEIKQHYIYLDTLDIFYTLNISVLKLYQIYGTKQQLVKYYLLERSYLYVKIHSGEFISKDVRCLLRYVCVIIVYTHASLIISRWLLYIHLRFP